MRYLNMLLCALMLYFVVVQYNDPDRLVWMAIYMVPAIWAAIAAISPPSLTSAVAKTLLSLSIIAAIGGVIYFWPDTPRWWENEVWYSTETAREGMGVMIATVVLLVVWLSAQNYQPVRKVQPVPG